MNKAVIIGIGIAIIIAAIAAIYAVSGPQGVDSEGKATIGVDEEIEGQIEQPKDETPLNIEADLEQGVGIESEATSP